MAAANAPRAGRDAEAALPRLRRVTGDFEITGDIKIRPADLYVSSGHRQPGVVLVGDAFETTCPVTGTGTDKVFTDVERLCNVHIPAWLATDGMDEDKIAAFYDDPVKTACDAWSSAKAYNFRSVSIETASTGSAQRWARFMAWLGEGPAAAARPASARPSRNFVRSILVLVIVVVIVVVGLIGRACGVWPWSSQSLR